MNSELIIRRWGKRTKPVRKLVLWGWNNSNTPCFLVLLGFHDFKGEHIKITESDIEQFNDELILTGQSEYKHEISPGEYHVLENDVTYRGYDLQYGLNLRDVSLKRVRKKPGYDNRYRYNYRYRYGKSRQPVQKETYLIERKWVYRDGKYEPKKYENLKSCTPVRVPFFTKLTYKEKVELIQKQGFKIEGFRLAENPNDILNLEKSNLKFLDLLVKVFSYDKLYMRKKYLSEIIDENPPKSIFLKILELGSVQIKCGLLLELAKRVNPILKGEIEEWVSKNRSYMSGYSRCADIYINAITPELKKARISEILEQTDELELIPVYVQIPSKSSLPRWTTLRRKSQGMSYDDYVNQWGYTEWKYIGNSLKFEPNLFTDGTSLKHIFLKNLLQEAEIYDIPEIVGKIMWFLDTPKTQYLLSNSGYTSTLIYLKRYTRRVIDDYVISNKANFTKALVVFFSNYHQNEVVPSGYSSRYSRRPEKTIQFNELLNYYLNYPRSTLKGSDSYDYYYSRRKFKPKIDSVDFKHERQTHKFELQTLIWKRNINSIIDVLRLSTVGQILSDFLKILKIVPDLKEKLEEVSTKYLVELALSENTNIATFLRERLLERIKQSNKFDPEIMLALLECSNTDLHTHAWEYFERVKGKFTPELLVELLFLANIEFWNDHFEEKINELDGKGYGAFLSLLINKIPMIIHNELGLPETIVEVLLDTCSKINEVPKNQKIEIIEITSDLLNQESKIIDWLARFIQNLICSLNYEDLKSIIKEVKADFKEPGKNDYSKSLNSLIRAIEEDRLPYDDELLDIIGSGTPRMVNTLVTMISENKRKLVGKSTTLLLLFESDMAILNELAMEVVDLMTKKQRDEMLSILIDSPIERAHQFALRKLDELFGEKIPKDLLIQMLEHTSLKVKAFVSNKVEKLITDLDKGNGISDLFMYYFKTLIFIPNFSSESKDNLYNIIPSFAFRNKKWMAEIQDILLKLGGSNIIKDSERALVALAKIKQEVENLGT